MCRLGFRQLKSPLLSSIDYLLIKDFTEPLPQQSQREKRKTAAVEPHDTDESSNIGLDSWKAERGTTVFSGK